MKNSQFTELNDVSGNYSAPVINVIGIETISIIAASGTTDTGGNTNLDN